MISFNSIQYNAELKHSGNASFKTLQCEPFKKWKDNESFIHLAKIVFSNKLTLQRQQTVTKIS